MSKTVFILRSGELLTHECFLFEVTLEIKEKSESNNYDLVPRQKGIFKLRSNVDRKVVVSVQQISQNSCNLAVERCFGMLVSPGRNVRHADMQLLEHVTMATTSSLNADIDFVTHVITGTLGGIQILKINITKSSINIKYDEIAGLPI